MRTDGTSRWRPGLWTILLAVAALVLLAAAAVAVGRAATPDPERIPPGVRIDGIAVGGLDAGEARRALLAGAEPPPGTVALGTTAAPDFRLEVSTAYLAPRPRIAAAVDEALGHDSFGRRLLGELGVAPGREVTLEWDVAPARIDEVTGRVVRQVERPPRNATVRVGDERITVMASQPGRRVDREALAAQLLTLEPRIEVPVAVVPAAISTGEAREAAATARAVAGRRRVVAAAGRSGPLTPEQLRTALEFDVEGGRIRPVLDGTVIERSLRGAFAPLLSEPRSASFRVTGDRVRIVAGRSGRRLDGAAIGAAVVRRPEATRVRARFTVSAPALTTAEARALRIREPVGEFTTEFPCCQPRVTNIRLAAEILDGAVIPPGGRFSLNEALGERTSERGFVAAPQINAGRLEDAVGGGVSQIATTFFNAAWFAGLALETHTPHEFYISRYPPGREATISWGGPELVVVNDWPAGLLVDASTTETSVTFRFFSARLGRRVETIMGPSPGGGAFTMEYSRRVFRGDALTHSDDFRWSYRNAPAP